MLSTKTRASEWTKSRQFGRPARNTVGASESQPGKRYRVTDHQNPNIPSDPKCVSTSWYCVDTTKACFRPRALVIRVWCCCKFKFTANSSAEDLCVCTTCTHDTAFFETRETSSTCTLPTKPGVQSDDADVVYVDVVSARLRLWGIHRYPKQ